MAGVLKLYLRSYSKSFNTHVFRNCSSFNHKTQASSICACNKLFNAFAKHKSEIPMIKQKLLFRKVALCQKRYIQISTILYEDKVVSTPEFPESITEGDIKWDKNVGDKVNTDDIVCEIETDKTSITVAAPAPGVIVEIFFKEGDTVKAGSQLFRMTLGPGAPAAAPPPAAGPPGPAPLAAKAPPPPPKAAPPPKGPLAVHGALVRVPPGSPQTEISGTRTEYRVKMNRMRLKISSRLKEAQNTCAMLTTFNEIDMSSLIAFRKAQQDAFTKKHGIKLGFMSPFIKAVTYALEDQPVVNAVIENNEVIYRDYIDLSIAVASPKGLLVPVIRNANFLNLPEIEKTLADLGKKARDGKLAVEDMEGGTFSVSNGGVFGSLLSTPIINLPQSAILGMHATFDRPVAIKGQVVIRPMMYIALTYDHRLIDGREAVMFLRKIKDGVEDPRIMLAGL